MVRIGLEVFATETLPELRDARLAVLCHAASVDQRFNHCVHRLLDAGAKVRALLGPEHGVFGAAQDMEPVEQEGDLLGIASHSLYGASFDSLRPQRGWLEGKVDGIVIDLQDVGSRYYTYVWTALYTVQVAAELGLPVWLLDRPNPIGDQIEGNLIEQGFDSFVGAHSVPVRHGLTYGEMLQLCVAELKLDVDLNIVKVQGLERGSWIDQVSVPWVMPSPNMPTLATATVYPGGCLYEGTSLSEGRGTTRPFELVGAPGISATEFAGALNALSLEGVVFRPAWFTPTFQKHARKLCGGVQLHITDRQRFAPYRAALALIAVAARDFPESFSWRTEAYEFVTEHPAIDLLVGGSWFREAVDAGTALDQIWRRASVDVDGYEQRVADIRLY